MNLRVFILRFCWGFLLFFELFCLQSHLLTLLLMLCFMMYLFLVNVIKLIVFFLRLLVLFLLLSFLWLMLFLLYFVSFFKQILIPLLKLSSFLRFPWKNPKFFSTFQHLILFLLLLYQQHLHLSFILLILFLNYLFYYLVHSKPVN
jgi:hypothetical protein